MTIVVCVLTSVSHAIAHNRRHGDRANARIHRRHLRVYRHDRCPCVGGWRGLYTRGYLGVFESEFEVNRVVVVIQNSAEPFLKIERVERVNTIGFISIPFMESRFSSERCCSFGWPLGQLGICGLARLGVVVNTETTLSPDNTRV